MSLRSALQTPDGKRQYVRRLFATIADRYDLITRLLSYGQDQRWKDRVVELAAPGAGDRVLDVACGTGDLAYRAARHAARVVGLDVTYRMLQLAAGRRPAEPGRARPDFITGDMLALPFRDASFDVITTGYGLRNVPALEEAIREIARVLAPGGRFVSLDFNRPGSAIVRAAYLAYLTISGSMLGLMLHGDPDTYRYIPESIRRYPGAPGVARLLEQHGFERVRIVPVLGGLMAIHVARKAA